MKKFATALLALGLVLGVVACGDQEYADKARQEYEKSNP